MADLMAEMSIILAAEARTVQRRRVTLRAFAREPHTQPFAVTILDLSTDGCRIAGDTAFEQGTNVWIKLPGLGARRARIAWTRAGEAGCEFAFPLRDELLDQVLCAARARRHVGRLRGRAES